MILIVFKMAVLFVLVTQFHRYFPIIGGGFHFLFALPLQLPVISRFWKFLTTGMFKLLFLEKLVSWILSGSGSLLGLLLYEKIFGAPATNLLYDTLFAAALSCLLYTAHGMLTFEWEDIEDRVKTSFTFMSKLGMFKEHLDAFTAMDRREIVSKLARTSFVDMYVSGLIAVLSPACLIFFSSAHLHWIATVPKASLTLWHSILATYSVASLGTGAELFEGEHWQVFRISLQLLIFIFVSLYVSLASSMIHDERLEVIINDILPSKPTFSEASLTEVLESIINKSAEEATHQQPAISGTEAKPGVARPVHPDNAAPKESAPLLSTEISPVPDITASHHFHPVEKASSKKAPKKIHQPQSANKHKPTVKPASHSNRKPSNVEGRQPKG